MIFSVVIYYTFVSLQYSTEIQQDLQSSQNLSSIFLQASIILIVFVAVFILYSNSFFTKRRKKELGLYSLLGVRKKTIARMLFYENLIMGAFACVIGIIAGTFLSKLFTLILFRLMGYVVEVGMNFSIEAVLNTLLVFGIIFLFTSIRGYRIIYKFKLIELFQAEKTGDVVPKASLFKAISAIILLAIGYFVLLQPIESDIQFFIYLTITTITLSIGTFLFISFVTVYMLKLTQKKKSFFYNGMNLIGLTQLLYRMKENARSLTIISLLSAVTLTLICTAYSMYYFNEQRVNEFIPLSYVHQSQSKNFDEKVKQIISGDDEHPLEAELEIPVLILDGVDFEAPGNYVTNPTKIISESTFNEAVLAVNSKDTVNLSLEEAVVLKPRLTEHSLKDYSGREVRLNSDLGETNLTIVDMKLSHILPWTYPDFYLIVSDEAYGQLGSVVETEILYKGYKVENHKASEVTSNILLNLEISEDKKMYTYYNEYKKGLEMSGVNLFLLGFLGLVFLSATGSIIYFKQLTEAHAEVKKYEVLRNLGVSKKEIRSTVAKQTFFVLALPLLIGICHSLMLLEGIKTIYGASYYDLTIPTIFSMASYFVIYLGYYVLTFYSYNKVVNE